jgi:DNA modification methylase
MDGATAHMVFTDPPYNLNYEGSNCQRMTNDNLGGDFETLSSGAIYICMSSSELHALFRAFTEAGGHWSTFIMWAKDRFTLGRSDYQRQFEPILYGWKEGVRHYWCGDRDTGDL